MPGWYLGKQTKLDTRIILRELDETGDPNNISGNRRNLFLLQDLFFESICEIYCELMCGFGIHMD